jgi:hypothetical protein
MKIIQEAEVSFNRQWMDDKKSSPMLAKYWLKSDRNIVLQKVLTNVIRKEIIFDAGIPEYEARFDEFPSPRQHDFFIYTVDYNTIISVEAKAGECWENYNTFGQEYDAAKRNLNAKSKKLPRCENLLKNYFCEREYGINNIVYQILAWFAGSLADAIRFKSENIIMLCQQFDLYDNVTNKNYAEFNKFIKIISNNISLGNVLDRIMKRLIQLP